MTGTSRGITFRQAKAFRDLIFTWKIKEFHHGDCVGADDEAATILHITLPAVIIHSHPCIIEDKRAHNPYANIVHEVMKPLSRNDVLVKVGTHMVGFPAGFREEQRGGTWYTIRKAARRKRPLLIILPDGRISTYEKMT